VDQLAQRDKKNRSGILLKLLNNHQKFAEVITEYYVVT
jgi:hypothetical protein